MIEYNPPYEISNEMLNKVSSISEKIGLINNIQILDNKPNLRKNNRIKSINSSLKIEANCLSFDAVKEILNGRNVIGPENEILEVKNAILAYDEIEKVDPYNFKELLRIHGIMTKGLIKESGSLRKENEGVFSGDKCIFIAPPPNMVPELMEKLFYWLNKNKKNIHPLILSSIFHYEFVFIHPFSDGNGRMARLWQNVLLYNWKNVFLYIPIENRIESFQEEYYNALSKSHVEGNSNAFIMFMLNRIEETLDDLIMDYERIINGSSVYVKKMLQVMENDIPYTSREIMEKLGLNSKETFRKNYINPAIENGLIIMTIPDKKNSKNQRYIKK